MTESNYTTAEVCKAAGVKRQRISQIVKDLGITPRSVGGYFLFNQEQYDLIMGRNRIPGRRKKEKA